MSIYFFQIIKLKDIEEEKQSRGMKAEFFKCEDWETHEDSQRFNFFLQVYDEARKPISDHPANDRCMWPTPWRKLNSQRERAIKKAEKLGLKRIY